MLVSVSRTNIDIDDELIERVMTIYRLPTKKEAVDFALRRLVGERKSTRAILELEGMGWGGDLDEMRSSDPVQEW
jgi:Arc/MetJ family transcription regulator